MPRLIWTPEALRDVVRLRAFLLPKNPDAARRAAATIRQGVRLLIAHPEVGRPMDDMLPDYREWVIAFGSAGYVALYRFDKDQVVILAIRHGSELPVRRW